MQDVLAHGGLRVGECVHCTRGTQQAEKKEFSTFAVCFVVAMRWAAAACLVVSCALAAFLVDPEQMGLTYGAAIARRGVIMT